MDQRGPCVAINTLAVNSPCSSCIIQSLYTTKQMHEFTFSGISSQRYAILDRKIDLKKINSKTDFQNRKPDFGFQTENRISGFRLTSLVSTTQKPLSVLLLHYCIIHFNITLLYNQTIHLYKTC